VKTNKYGEVTITEQEAVNALYEGVIDNLENVYIDNIDIITKYNQSREANADRIPELKIPDSLSISIEEFDKINQSKWFMPEEYQNLDLTFIYQLCGTQEQHARVTEELELFYQHNMIDLLKYIKYLVDTMRKNNIVWGVGRGSSVASYVLFLLGVHKVDSIRYNLDINEFLK
jgi:DNA polymerase III alpha subunit